MTPSSSIPPILLVRASSTLDSIGPAESLYTDSFYNTMKAALKKGGIICTQGECQWLHLPLIRKVMDNAASLYSSVRYAFTTIPTYPCGQIGFIMSIKDSGVDERYE